MKQQEKLNALNKVLECCKSSPFYRDRIPGKLLRNLEELKQIPLTTKDDLRQCSPFGLICVSRRELYQYHETFGTTGVPVSTWLTREDIRDTARGLNQLGVKFNSEDTVLIRFPYAISAIAHMIHTAAQMKRACVIPVSSRSFISPFSRVVNLLKKLEVTVLAGLPLQAVLIAETAEIMGLNPKRDFPHLRAICTAGEPLPPGKRKLLEEIWGVPIFDNYGMAEIGAVVIDCEFCRPHPLEDYVIYELLDEDLKTEVKPGEIGYLVVTTLKKRATPMIRYLTGDRARVVEKECACGKKVSLEIRGRRDDTLKVGNRLLDIWDLDDIVSYFPCRRFWVVGSSLEGLHFALEEEKEGDCVGQSVVSMLEEKYNMKIRVEVVPKGALYDRGELLAVGVVGKPRYIYTAEEMEKKTYLKSLKM